VTVGPTGSIGDPTRRVSNSAHVNPRASEAITFDVGPRRPGDRPSGRRHRYRRRAAGRAVSRPTSGGVWLARWRGAIRRYARGALYDNIPLPVTHPQDQSLRRGRELPTRKSSKPRRSGAGGQLLRLRPGVSRKDGEPVGHRLESGGRTRDRRTKLPRDRRPRKQAIGADAGRAGDIAGVLAEVSPRRAKR